MEIDMLRWRRTIQKVDIVNLNYQKVNIRKGIFRSCEPRKWIFIIYKMDFQGLDNLLEKENQVMAMFVNQRVSR
jgi:hypothetical protein